MYLFKLRCELNNLILKVLEALNLRYSLTSSSQNIKELFEKKPMMTFILSNVEG